MVFVFLGFRNFYGNVKIYVWDENTASRGAHFIVYGEY